MPARVLTLGDLHEALHEAPYDTMIEVTLRPDVNGRRRVEGTISSVVPELDSRGMRVDASNNYTNPKLVETLAHADTVEELVNKLITDHAGNLIARLGVDYPGHAHYSHKGDTTWWTDCNGCRDCVRRSRAP